MSIVHSYDIDSMVNAAGDGNIAWVENCLNAGVDINGKNGGMNACQVAIRNNQFAVLKLLIERGANLQNLLNIVRIDAPNKEMAILLLDAGAPIDVAKAISLVSQTKSIVVLQRILARGLDLSGPCDCYDGQTLCHLVSYSASDVCLLLKATVTLANNDVNARDFAGATALYKACSQS
jgi:ankyrin repeat protein